MMGEARSPDDTSELERSLTLASGLCVAESMLEQTPTMAVVARKPDGKIISASQFMGQIGHLRRDLEGLLPGQVIERLNPLHPDGRRFALEELSYQRALQGEMVTCVEGSVRDAHGEQIPVVTNAAPIRNRRGRILGAIAVCTDIRPQKAQEEHLRRLVEEKDALYRELAHRVENHLHIMTGLIQLETRGAPIPVADFARLIQGRLTALASVYENMTERRYGAACIDSRAFVDHVCAPYRTDEVAVDVVVLPPDLTLSSDQARPLGMILNEAVCNSYKHAFPARNGHIEVMLTREQPGRLALEISDDGVGLHASTTNLRASR